MHRAPLRVPVPGVGAGQSDRRRHDFPLEIEPDGETLADLTVCRVEWVVEAKPESFEARPPVLERRLAYELGPQTVGTHLERARAPRQRHVVVAHDHDAHVRHSQIRPVPGGPLFGSVREPHETTQRCGAGREIERPPFMPGGHRRVRVVYSLVPRREPGSETRLHHREMVPSLLGDIPVNSNQGVVCGPVNPGRAFEINADGVRVHAVEWTPAVPRSEPTAARRRVLLVHGLGANTLSWEPVGQPLVDRLGATVTAIDLVGFGRTRAPERQATISTNRRLVIAVLREIGPAIVVGNSMGGSIGIGVTATNPELVDALVLVDPAVPHPNPGVADWLRLSRMAPVMVTRLGRAVLGTRARVMGPERLVDSSIGWSLHDPTRLDPDLRRRLIELAAERYNYPEAAGGYVDAARSMLMYIARGVRGDLTRAAASTPTLIVQGEYDRLVSMAAARGAAALHPSIDLEVLDGIGHAPQLEDPDLFVSVVTTWLDAHELADVGAD